jgi:hypothetical protein
MAGEVKQGEVRRMFWLKNPPFEPLKIVSISDVPGSPDFRNVTYELEKEDNKFFGPVLMHNKKIEIKHQIVISGQIFEAKSFREALGIQNKWSEDQLEDHFKKIRERIDRECQENERRVTEWRNDIMARKKLNKPKSFWKWIIG